MLKTLFSRDRPPSTAPRVPAGHRVYAIGDIHGADAEFARLIDMIDADHAGRSQMQRTIVLLGDLIDRGPDSAGVVARALRLSAACDTRLLAGNHEELLLMACAGDGKALRIFAHNGGRETALSYGVEPAAYDDADFETLPTLLRSAIPTAHREFIATMENLVVIGDYAFVHAGVRPGVALAEQVGEDLRWIRGAFLKHRLPLEKFIIHGHTITDQVDEQPNRIGIDTGAYATGRLTAIALEDDRRWYLST